MLKIWRNLLGSARKARISSISARRAILAIVLCKVQASGRPGAVRREADSSRRGAVKGRARLASTSD